MSRELFQRGDRLGDYEVLTRLRAGGMATLFLGRRHNVAGVSRQVAIKVIHPHLADDELIVKMFIDEARISSHIAHGNVVYVENFGQYDGVYYMAMEYVDGCSLDQVLRATWQRRETLPPEVAVHIALEAAAGLHAAHETRGEDGEPLGIVHRDVSPSNVLLTVDGRVKVIDFGIAKARGRLGATKSGHSLKGKIRYMSPEQAWGRDIDRKTDVYALGVVLWELLACKPLFRDDDDLRLLELVRNPTIPSVRNFNADVNAALEAVIQRATAKDPAARIATASELRRELIRAVPDALTVPTEMLGKLVERTRHTLGIQPIEVEEDVTTPAKPAAIAAGSQPPPESPIEVSRTELSAARGSGEVHAKPRRRGVAIAGVAIGTIAIGAVAIVALSRSSGGTQPDAPAPRPAPVAQPAPPPAAPVVHDVQPAPKPAVVAPAGSGSAVATSPKPTPTKPRPPATRHDVGGVEVDGVLLADPDQGKPKPKPKTKPDVKVDGTPLAP